MATRIKMSEGRQQSSEETPIKHTSGGEMPDPAEIERHHLTQSELEEGLDAQEGVEAGVGGMTELMSKENIQKYLPAVLTAIGVGAGIYFLVRGLVRRRRYHEEGDVISSEAESALEIDEVEPSRLMGS